MGAFTEKREDYRSNHRNIAMYRAAQKRKGNTYNLLVWNEMDQHVNPGERYIYFNSLNTYEPKYDPDKKYSKLYKKTYDKAYAAIHSGVNNLFNDSEDASGNKVLNEMQNVIDMLTKTMQNEAEAEQQLAQRLASLQNNNKINLTEAGVDKNGNIINYNAFITLINDLKQGRATFLKILKEEVGRIENLNKQKNDFVAAHKNQEKILRMLNRNYSHKNGPREYQKYLDERSKVIDSLELNGNLITKQIHDSIMYVLNQNLKQDDLQEIVEKVYLNNNNRLPSNDEIKSIILGAIAQKVIDDYSQKKNNRKISDYVQEQAVTMAFDNSSNLMTQESSKLIEQLRQNNLEMIKHGTGIYDAIVNMPKHDQDSLYELLGLNQQDSIWKTGISGKQIRVKGTVQKHLQQLNDEINELQQNDGNSAAIANRKGQYSKLIQKAINNALSNATSKDILTTQIRKIFENNINFKLNTSDSAELVAGMRIYGQISPTNRTYVKADIGGRKHSNKNDITLGYIIDDPSSVENIILQSVKELFIKDYDNARAKLEDVKELNPYELTSSMYNVRAELLAYQQTMDTVINNLKQQYDNDKEITDVLSNLVQEGISVKYYDFYDNDIGFHGGSLGGNGRVDKVIDNIVTMYEIGGISNIDRDALIWAVLNCSSHTVGADLKEPIQYFLLGGAALAMFDRGFSNMQEFRNYMDKNFNGGKIKESHFYQLNGVYFPASFILKLIIDKLNKVVQDISSQITDHKAGGYVEIYNPINIGDIDSREYNGEKRWNDVKNTAYNAVNIRYMFMAGILDIFNGLLKFLGNPTP